MGARVEIRIARAPRGMRAFPALAAAAVLPWAWAFAVSRGPDLDEVGDAVFWVGVALCAVLPLAPIAVAVRGWRRMDGRALRLGLVFAALASLALSVPAGGASLMVGAFAIASGVDYARVSPPVRRAMRVPPAVAARRALARGDASFLGIHSFIAFATPGVESRCVKARYGVRPLAVRGNLFDSPAQGRFMGRAWDYAERYNRELGAALGLSPADLVRHDDCEVPPERGAWPVE